MIQFSRKRHLQMDSLSCRHYQHLIMEHMIAYTPPPQEHIVDRQQIIGDPYDCAGP